MKNHIDKIVLENVNFAYNDKFLYDEGINATLEKGKIYLLSGPNGCGKSTLANILLKMWRNYKGKVLIDGKNLELFTKVDISNIIGLSFQKTPIFHDTIRNNICLGKEGDVEKLVSLIDFEMDLSAMHRDLNSWLKDISSLSGGQAQKIGILRTLFLDKPVYIFDEATANLDKKSKEKFFELMKEIKKEKIIILISHEEDIFQHIDKVIEIKGGILR